MAAHGIMFFGETIIPRCHANDFFNKDQQPLVNLQKISLIYSKCYFVHRPACS